MAKSNLSILGLYMYDSSLFDGFNVPAGMVKALAVNQIVMNCAELEILYTDFDFLKDAIAQWSSVNQANWLKLYNTTILDYNPIWNKDGKITETEIIGKDSKAEGSNSTTGNAASNTINNGKDINKVAAFNSGTFENSTSIESDNVNTDTSNTATQGSYEDNIKNNEVRTYERKEQGNIGVTTTQSMIEEEREVDLFNMYEIIANDFKNRFCLVVY